MTQLTEEHKPDVRIVIEEFDFDAIPDDWSALTDVGRSISAAHDRNRWFLGDLGMRVAQSAKYGESLLSKFARDINVGVKVLYEYHAVSSFYDRGVRHYFPTLTWSHWNIARRLKGFEKAMDILKRAHDEGWDTEVLRQIVKEMLKGNDPIIVKRDVMTEECRVHRIEQGGGENNTLTTFVLPVSMTLYDLWQAGTNVIVTISYEEEVKPEEKS